MTVVFVPFFVGFFVRSRRRAVVSVGLHGFARLRRVSVFGRFMGYKVEVGSHGRRFGRFRRSVVRAYVARGVVGYLVDFYVGGLSVVRASRKAGGADCYCGYKRN